MTSSSNLRSATVGRSPNPDAIDVFFVLLLFLLLFCLADFVGSSCEEHGTAFPTRMMVLNIHTEFRTKFYVEINKIKHLYRRSLILHFPGYL